jgi:hypothetical protein
VQVDGLLRELNARVPWAFIGFTAQLQAAWKKNRKQVLDEVEARKRKATAEGPPPEPPPIQVQ